MQLKYLGFHVFTYRKFISSVFVKEPFFLYGKLWFCYDPLLFIIEIFYRRVLFLPSMFHHFMQYCSAYFLYASLYAQFVVPYWYSVSLQLFLMIFINVLLALCDLHYALDYNNTNLNMMRLVLNLKGIYLIFALVWGFGNVLTYLKERNLVIDNSLEEQVIQ